MSFSCQGKLPLSWTWGHRSRTQGALRFGKILPSYANLRPSTTRLILPRRVIFDLLDAMKEAKDRDYSWQCDVCTFNNEGKYATSQTCHLCCSERPSKHSDKRKSVIETSSVDIPKKKTAKVSLESTLPLLEQNDQALLDIDANSIGNREASIATTTYATGVGYGSKGYLLGLENGYSQQHSTTATSTGASIHPMCGQMCGQIGKENHGSVCAGGANGVPNCPSHNRPCRVVFSHGRLFFECTMPFGYQCTLFECSLSSASSTLTHDNCRAESTDVDRQRTQHATARKLTPEEHAFRLKLDSESTSSKPLSICKLTSVITSTVGGIGETNVDRHNARVEQANIRASGVSLSYAREEQAIIRAAGVSLSCSRTRSLANPKALRTIMTTADNSELMSSLSSSPLSTMPRLTPTSPIVSSVGGYDPMKYICIDIDDSPFEDSYISHCELNGVDPSHDDDASQDDDVSHDDDDGLESTVQIEKPEYSLEEIFDARQECKSKVAETMRKAKASEEEVAHVMTFVDSIGAEDNVLILLFFCPTSISTGWQQISMAHGGVNNPPDFCRKTCCSTRVMDILYAPLVARGYKINE
jgi:hypothetical protein